jgi:lysozyme
MMNISKEGIDLIKSFEGLRLKSYKAHPAEEFYTIGYGHYGVKNGLTITEAKATEMLIKDLAGFVSGVNHVLGSTKVNQHQFDALVSFSYNLGLGSLQSSTLLKLIKANRFEEASHEFAKWNKISTKDGKEVLDGLTRRREAERKLFVKATGGIVKKPVTVNPVRETVVPKKPVVKPVAPTTTYKVKSGDTVTAIAKKYKTTVANLVKLNHLKDADEIKVGQTLKLK